MLKATPTFLVTDNKGTILRALTGKLPESAEEQVLSVLRSIDR